MSAHEAVESLEAGDVHHGLDRLRRHVRARTDADAARGPAPGLREGRQGHHARPHRDRPAARPHGARTGRGRTRQGLRRRLRGPRLPPRLHRRHDSHGPRDRATSSPPTIGHCSLEEHGRSRRTSTPTRTSTSCSDSSTERSSTTGCDTRRRGSARGWRSGRRPSWRPDAYPYLQSGQIEGLVGGLKGAAEYETLIGYRAGHAGHARAAVGAPARHRIHHSRQPGATSSRTEERRQRRGSRRRNGSDRRCS